MAGPARVVDFAGSSVLVFAHADEAASAAADWIVQKINSALAQHGRAVAGLATGATPEPVYARLVALHRAGALSFAALTSYNLDEYYPIDPLDPRSYRAYMHRHLFAHVDIAPNRAHVLDGTVPEASVVEHATQYDRWIDADGGLDLQLLGIGRNGHIGFNEPSELPVQAALALPTRLVDLHPMTRADALKEFGAESLAPRRALTMGVASILAARAILMFALGPAKAAVVARALTEPMTARVPASLLQSVAGKVTWMLDAAAACNLS